MSHTDPLADMLTRIRNANRVGQLAAVMPHSIMKEAVAKVLAGEGYLSGTEVIHDGPHKQLVVTLKYTATGDRVMTDAQRVSRPGRRVYVGHEEIRKVRAGLGVSVLTTPKGVMADTMARKHNVGGEVLCEVW